MNIEQFSDQDGLELAAFKAAEWPSADLQHFGEGSDYSHHKITLICRDDAGIVGYGTLSTDSGVGHIESILIGENYRGKGFATQLVIALEDSAMGFECHKIWLETGSDWAARFLYEKLGYQRRMTLADHYGGKDFLYYDKLFKR